MTQPTIAHLVGGGPADGWTTTAEVPWPTICVCYALTPWGPFYTLKYQRESVDPDGMLATYVFQGWPEELEGWLADADDRP